MKIGTGTKPRYQKSMLNVNDIIRYNGIVYRVEFIQQNGTMYILHDMEHGVRIPCMLKNRTYTILVSKRLKNDIKRSVRNLRRYSKRNEPEKPQSMSSYPAQPIETVELSSGETSKIHIVESYITEQEVSLSDSDSVNTEKESHLTEEKKVEQVVETTSHSVSTETATTASASAYMSYCSIM